MSHSRLTRGVRAEFERAQRKRRMPASRPATAACELGGMLSRAYNYMEISPEQMYAPGLAILVVALAFNALGESLRIVLDPTMKDR